MTIYKLVSEMGLSLSVLDIATWPELDLTHHSPETIRRYERMKQAITRVVRDRLSFSSAAREAGIDRKELRRALTRCLTLDVDGSILGFRSLLPYFRIATYVKIGTPDGTAGSFAHLMELFPTIDEALWKAWKAGESVEQLRKLLLEELLPDVGWPTHRYPYNTATRALEALRRHLRRREQKHLGEKWEMQGDMYVAPPIVRPFQCVQLDAHRCDAHFTVHIEGPDGLSRTLVLERIWVLILIDVGCRGALGYALSLNRQCNISDVLEAVHTAMVPQARRTPTIPGLSYRPGAGFPNVLLPVCAYQKFDLITLDNALAHRSPRLHEILNDKLQCGVRLNRAGTPNDNQFVERFFSTLTAHGMKRTPTTTGSGPQDPRRTDSEALAAHYEFSLSDAEELLDVLIANYNAEMHRGIYATPLDYLRRYYQEVPAIVRQVPEAERGRFSLRELWDEVKIRGGTEKREDRPFIQYLDAEYRGDCLNLHPELIGKDIMILLSIDDMRTMTAYHKDGRPIGSLYACGRWSLTRHSLKTRQLIIRMARRGLLDLGYRDPVRALVATLQERAKKDKSAVNQVARLLAETGEHPERLIGVTDQEEEAKTAEIVHQRNDWLSLRTPVYD